MLQRPSRWQDWVVFTLGPIPVAAQGSDLGRVLCVGVGVDTPGSRLFANLPAASARRPPHTLPLRIQERSCGKATEASLQAKKCASAARSARSRDVWGTPVQGITARIHLEGSQGHSERFF